MRQSFFYLTKLFFTKVSVPNFLFFLRRLPTWIMYIRTKSFFPPAFLQPGRKKCRKLPAVPNIALFESRSSRLACDAKVLATLFVQFILHTLLLDAQKLLQYLLVWNDDTDARLEETLWREKNEKKKKLYYDVIDIWLCIYFFTDNNQTVYG